SHRASTTPQTSQGLALGLVDRSRLEHTANHVTLTSLTLEQGTLESRRIQHQENPLPRNRAAPLLLSVTPTRRNIEASREHSRCQTPAPGQRAGPRGLPTARNESCA